jgi:molybdopterin molybdotransferase
VALIATGKELVHHSTRELPPAAIRNSNVPYLAAALPSHGAECVLATQVGDEVADFRAALERAAAAGADLVITTGAVSAGRHDFVAEQLAALDARLRFHKAAIRPGKPLLFAELPAGPAVLGLPGNPVATAVGLRFFASAFLRAAAGLPPELPVRAALRAEARKPRGLRWFAKARLHLGPAGAAVDVLPGQGSAMVGSLLAADAWAVLAEEGDRCPAGAEVEAFPLEAPGACP